MTRRATVPEGLVTWHVIRKALTRPYPVTAPMVLLVSLVPLYILIAQRASEATAFAPVTALDRLLPLVPAWALVYGALYAFLILLPVLVVQQVDLIRRTVWAYITVWSVSYVCFLIAPTIAPRPDTVSGDGFAVWGLQTLYEADPPYNCFPSIHVAHSFVSALACSRVHRTLGIVALAAATLVALSTLLAKQHYVADVVAGAALAMAASSVFLSGFPRAGIPEADRRGAPALALSAGAVAGLGVLGAWVVYALGWRL